MIINVRGALGTQVVETLYGMTEALRLDERVEEIHINTGGNIADHVKVDYISELFDFGVPIKLVDGYEKQDAWNYKAIKQIMDNVVFCRSFQKFMFDERQTAPILHYRSRDRQLISPETYSKIYCSDYRYVMIGDDPKHCSGGTPVEDWNLILNSADVTCSFTTFVFSTLIFDPYKEVSVFPQSMEDGTHTLETRHYDTVEQLMTLFPGLRWYDDKSSVS